MSSSDNHAGFNDWRNTGRNSPADVSRKSSIIKMSSQIVQCGQVPNLDVDWLWLLICSTASNVAAI